MLLHLQPLQSLLGPIGDILPTSITASEQTHFVYANACVTCKTSITCMQMSAFMIPFALWKASAYGMPNSFSLYIYIYTYICAVRPGSGPIFAILKARFWPNLMARFWPR